MLEIIDDYCWEDHKKVITFDKHKVLGLKNLAYWSLSRAVPPTPLHHHSGIIEIHCLTKGTWYCQVYDSVYAVKGNELFITLPYEVHSNENLPQSPCSFYGFQIDLNHKDELLGLNKEYSHALCDILLNPTDRHMKFNAAHSNLLKQAFTHIAKGTPSSIHSGVQYLCCFLFDLNNLLPVSYMRDYKIDKYIQQAIDHIEKNFKEPIPLKELASVAGYSLSRFQIKFKEEVGITPAEFISLRKIEYAKYQLTHTDVSISELAYEIGFSSSNYFSSVFNKLSNYTPSDYRNQCRIKMAKEEKS